MKKPIVFALVAAAAAFAWFSLPSAPPPAAEGHAGHAGDPAVLADGVVVSVDSAASMVTIRHGPLVNLGMPPMTMGFQVADPAMFDRLKTGDRVKFHADTIGGAFTATRIEIAN